MINKIIVRFDRVRASARVSARTIMGLNEDIEKTNVERNTECDCNIWVNYTSREGDSLFQELEETCEAYGEDSAQRSNVPLSFSKEARRFN